MQRLMVISGDDVREMFTCPVCGERYLDDTGIQPEAVEYAFEWEGCDALQSPCDRCAKRAQIVFGPRAVAEAWAMADGRYERMARLAAELM